MPNFYYLDKLVPDPEDATSQGPSLLLEFPYLQATVQEPNTHPAIPQARVLVKVLNIDGNLDRAILAIPEVSKFTPPADFPY